MIRESSLEGMWPTIDQSVVEVSFEPAVEKRMVWYLRILIGEWFSKLIRKARIVLEPNVEADRRKYQGWVKKVATRHPYGFADFSEIALTFRIEFHTFIPNLHLRFPSEHNLIYSITVT